MAKLWQKSKIRLNPIIEKYTVGEDYLFDQSLMLFDVEASQAQAKGLQVIGLLSGQELAQLLSALTQLAKDYKKGKIKIKVADEDCHTVIENYLVEKLGPTGSKIHTGRSRNDQVLVALRLYMKSAVNQIQCQGLKLASSFLALAKQYQKVPLPGYSHTQQAMLSSVGHYFASYLESLLDDLEFLKAIYKQIDKNPLGGAAGFGVGFPLDREFTAKKLGFNSVQMNSLYCQSSRGKLESLFLEGLVQIMLTLGKFANDLILFTTQEFDFFEVHESLVTGSSIMPQKKNLDVLEILRASVSVVTTNQKLIQDITKNLISGYHRDLQLIKKPLLQSVKIILDSLEVAGIFLGGIKPKEKSIEDKIRQEIFMADVANNLVKKKKLPFREAYKKAAEETKRYKINPRKNIEGKISLGAPGNLNLEYYQKKIKKLGR